MSRTIATVLLDLAAWIAPPHRRDWIAGLRVEADVVDHSTIWGETFWGPTLWAWGALTTATGQRLADTVASGLALRLVLGGFVIGVATGFAVFIAARIPDIEASAVRAGSEKLMPLALMLTAIILSLFSGGLAIVFSAGRPWFNRYGRLVFALGGLAFGLPLAGALTQHTAHWQAVTAYQHQQNMLSTLAGALFIAAAPALLFRRGRLFLVLAGGALAIEIAQYAMAMPYLPQGVLPAIAFFNACGPGLLILAASGLLIRRRLPAAI